MKKISIIISLLIVAIVPMKTFAASNIIDWYGERCVEFTADGDVLDYVDIDICRELRGTAIKFVGDNCYEFTTRKDIIGKVDVNYCRESDGAFHKRIKKTTPPTPTPVPTKVLPKQMECEEVVPEQYVICGGTKYIPDLKNNNGLQRNMKNIQKVIDTPEKSTKTRSTSK